MQRRLVMHKRKRPHLILGAVVLVALLACNFPGIASTGDSGNVPADTQPVGPLADTQSPPADVALDPTQPTITIQRATGYIFSTNQPTASGDDYDIYWNNAEIVALSKRSQMVSLGVKGSLSEVTQIDVMVVDKQAFVPTEGEVFAVRLVKGDGFEYALIRFLGLVEDRAISLEYVYPFQGTILDNP
jgi:hypothetical protein